MLNFRLSRTLYLTLLGRYICHMIIPSIIFYLSNKPAVRFSEAWFQKTG